MRPWRLRPLVLAAILALPAVGACSVKGQREQVATRASGPGPFSTALPHCPDVGNLQELAQRSEGLSADGQARCAALLFARSSSERPLVDDELEMAVATADATTVRAVFAAGGEPLSPQTSPEGKFTVVLVRSRTPVFAPQRRLPVPGVVTGSDAMAVVVRSPMASPDASMLITPSDKAPFPQLVELVSTTNASKP